MSNNIRLSAKKDWFLGINYFYLSPLQIEIGELRPIQSADISVKKSGIIGLSTYNFVMLSDSTKLKFTVKTEAEITIL
jgi:hypothetical protein